MSVVRGPYDDFLRSCPRCGAAAAVIPALARRVPSRRHAAPGSGPAEFRCDVVADRARVIVRPVGELDLATADAVEQPLRELRDVGFDHLVVDLGRLSFMDSSGVHLLTRWAASAESEGWTFEVRPGCDAVERVLELTGLQELLSRGTRDWPAA